MANLLDDLKELLQQDERLVVDGKLLKNKVIELALQLDSWLLKMLLSNPSIKKHFFQQIGAFLVFDKIKFQKFVSNKDFLPDSYTSFKNKIGLVTVDEFVSEKKEVTLSWAYKDCVLEGGQSKDDAKRDEIFWNETLASDEIDRLLSPKVLTNWKRVNPKEEKPIDANSKINFEDENLIIKGNNLLALHSISKRYLGSVKLIYIDPPYNTGNDSFKYNDRFNHSTWLTFMKNRLEIARSLLTEDGSIWVSLDDSEVHYCKVLMDEIFGRENFISTIIWNSKYTVSNDAKYVSYQHENILFYAKNKEQFHIGLLDRTDETNSSYRNPDKDPKGVWKATPIHAKSGKEEKNYTIEFPNGFTWTPPKGRFPRYSKQRLMDIYNESGLYFNKNGGIDKKTYLSEVKQGVTVGSVWSYDEVGHTHANNEELAAMVGKGAFNNPKGTKLLKRIIKVGNVADKEIVLDFHLGSGTTAQAVLDYNKENDTNIKFIGIEQMDYIEGVTKDRIQKAMEANGEGSYIFLELAKLNELYISDILKATNSEELTLILKRVENGAFVDFRVDLSNIELQESGFSKLSFENQRDFLLEVLDKNMSYIPLTEIDDADYAISDLDKSVNNMFYNK
ncbi:MAG: site-specific DNA-methyltransferase [Chitinophagaceae bacterium]